MCPETHKNEPQSHVFALSILPLVSILHQTRGVRKATYEKRFYGQYGVRVPNDNPLPTTTSRFSHFWPEKWPPISAKSACRTRPKSYHKEIIINIVQEAKRVVWQKIYQKIARLWHSLISYYVGSVKH